MTSTPIAMESSGTVVPRSSAGPATSGIVACRSDFPSVSRAEAYLDSAASSLTPESVIDAMVGYYRGYRANVNRGAYKSSLQASSAYESSVESLAAFIGASANQMVVTMNATHALNLVALSLTFKPGDEIVVPTLEHASNMMPWVRVAKTQGVRLKWWNPDPQGHLRIEDLMTMLNERTRLITVAQVSNVLGTIAPIKEIAALCKQRDILLCVDACQSAPHLPVDVKALGCDFLVLSAHKMLGPTGAGALYVRDEVAHEYPPAIIGSDAVDNSSCPGMAACASGQMPETKWTVAGTPPIAEMIGWAEALRYLKAVGFDAIRAHDELLTKQVVEGLKGLPGVRVHGPADMTGRTSIVSFNIEGLPNEEVGRILTEDFGISVRAGTHCARGYFMENQTDEEVYGSVRASFYLYNTPEEARLLVDSVRQIAETCAV